MTVCHAGSWTKSSLCSQLHVTLLADLAVDVSCWFSDCCLIGRTHRENADPDLLAASDVEHSPVPECFGSVIRQLGRTRCRVHIILQKSQLRADDEQGDDGDDGSSSLLAASDHEAAVDEDSHHCEFGVAWIA